MAVLIREGETDADIDAALGGQASAPLAAAAAAAATPANGQAAAGNPGARIFASPLVRKIALREADRLGWRDRHRAQRPDRAA